MINVAFFKDLPLFTLACSENLEMLAKSSKLLTYRKNQTFSYERTKNIFIYVIKGWLKLFKETSDGVETIVDILGEGNYCGEHFIFDIAENEPYKAQSISHVKLLVIPIQNLRHVITHDHTFALNFLKHNLRKQQRLHIQREHLSTQNATDRIACFILRLCEAKSLPQKTLKLTLPYDKTLLASQLGMRPETFSRALNNLKRKCGIHIKGGQIDINNLTTLINYVCHHCSNMNPCNVH